MKSGAELTVIARHRSNLSGGDRGCDGQQGFTLIEMAIVLAIMGLLIGMLAPVLGGISENNRAEATSMRLNAIDDAMVVFLRLNGRLPCPAAPDGDPLGLERSACSVDADNDGIVPFRSLGLSQAEARDGYNNYFSYHVARAYADPNLSQEIADPLGFCLAGGQSPEGDLDIQDRHGDSLSVQDIAYVVVSHGKNGHGRYNPPGTDRVNDHKGGLLEDENVDGDTQFIESVRIEVEGNDGPYDDTMSWKTRDGLAGRAVEFGCTF